PSSSAAPPQPEPSTSAMSCPDTPVLAAMCSAAAAATSKGSVVGSSRSGSVLMVRGYRLVHPGTRPRAPRLRAARRRCENGRVTPLDPAAVPPHVVVVGGGPGGYEAALVARSHGAPVTVVEQQGLGGAAVLTDVVPSKTLIATAEWMTIADRAPELGIRTPDDVVDPLSDVAVSLATGGIPVVSAYSAPGASGLGGSGVQAAASS